MGATRRGQHPWEMHPCQGQELAAICSSAGMPFQKRAAFLCQPAECILGRAQRRRAERAGAHKQRSLALAPSPHPLGTGVSSWDSGTLQKQLPPLTCSRPPGSAVSPPTPKAPGLLPDAAALPAQQRLGTATHPEHPRGTHGSPSPSRCVTPVLWSSWPSHCPGRFLQSHRVNLGPCQLPLNHKTCSFHILSLLFFLGGKASPADPSLPGHPKFSASSHLERSSRERFVLPFWDLHNPQMFATSFS